jgi:hypothetical protein
LQQRRHETSGGQFHGQQVRLARRRVVVLPPQTQDRLAPEARRLDADTDKLRQSKDRSFITKIVFAVYAGGVAAYILYLFLERFYYGQEVKGDFLAVIKIAILPVVTLVMGYYFTVRSN